MGWYWKTATWRGCGLGLGLAFGSGLSVGVRGKGAWEGGMGRGRLRGELVDDVADGPPLVEAHVARAEREAVHLVRVRAEVRARFGMRVVGC